MSKKSVKNELEGVFEGSGNVFEDLNIPNAAENELKAQLAIRLNAILEGIVANGSSQSDIAKRLGIKQPNVSQLMNYRLLGFSAERLMQFLVGLGHSLTICVASEPSEKACINVVEQSSDSGVTPSILGSIFEAQVEWRQFIGSKPAVHQQRADRDVQEDYYSAVVAAPIERITAKFANAPRGHLQ
ncbi:MAG TPA: helix-turn-helix transcriptional regulator [Xanthomonadaceae bacterium]|nr:helix-turn-helix transcriptional regulator [Xanthomonadaceae bacterium]